MSAPRVYLFADFGKGPRVADRYQEDPRGLAFAWKSARVAASREWWLVECESAGAGRAIITATSHGERFEPTPGVSFKHEACECGACRCEHAGGYVHGPRKANRCERYRWQPGRILDSGGAR